jgi:hypothetical protein
VVPGTTRGIALSNICQAAGLYIRKIIVGTYTYSEAQFLYIYLTISKRNLCMYGQISTDLNISKAGKHVIQK